MITLGIELSSRQGSVALLTDGAVLAEKTWIAERVRHNGIFQTLDAMLEETRLSYADIGLYAVGRGPGSFSGMRMSLAVAQALALPSKTAVRAVSSGAALALSAARDGASKICVAGDARRGQFWAGFFEADRGGVMQLHPRADWTLIPYESLIVPDGTLLISSEAERLKQWFPQIGGSRFPQAADVARLAEIQVEAEPLEPLYLHPPVFVEPRGFNRE